jgi:hypothetical protein
MNPFLTRVCLGPRFLAFRCRDKAFLKYRKIQQKTQLGTRFKQLKTTKNKLFRNRFGARSSKRGFYGS